MTRIKRVAIIGGAVVVLAGIGWLVVQRIENAAPAGTLYGNVEIRQADLAFNSEGTVTVMYKQEGDPIKTGDVIAALDATTYRSAEALATARRAAGGCRCWPGCCSPVRWWPTASC